MVNPGDESGKPAGEGEALLKDEVPMVEIAGPQKGGAGNDAEAGSSNSTEKKPTLDFVGLTKEELDHFAKDPFWRRLRLVLFALFWLVWFGMLAAVIVIIVVSPKCPPRPTRYFWQKPFYRLQVRSFAPASLNDDDTSKLGSLSGLKSKLPYLREELGLQNFIVDSLVARADSGCPADFSAMNPTLGSMEELRALTKLGRKKGFSFLMELDASQADDAWGDGDASSFWRRQPATLVLSRDGKAAWKDGRLRTPRIACSSLNSTSAVVRRRLQSAMSLWLDAGLSGFVLSNVAFVSPDVESGEKVGNLGRLYSNASVEFVSSTRGFLDAEAERLGRELALFVDLGDVGAKRPSSVQLRRYAEAGAHAVLNSRLGRPLAKPGVGDRLEAKELLDAVRSTAALSPAEQQRQLLATNWPYLRRRPQAALTALILTLPGVASVYYGQELGMRHAEGVRFVGNATYSNPSYLAGAESTDASETPMQWSGGSAAGWLSNKSLSLDWAPALAEKRGDDIRANNLLTLNAAGHPQSTLQLTQLLVEKATSVESLQWGNLRLLAASGELLAFARKAERFPSAVVVANVGKRPMTLSLPAAFGEAELLAAHSWGGASHAYEVGEKFDLASAYAPPETLLLFLADDA